MNKIREALDELKVVLCEWDDPEVRKAKVLLEEVLEAQKSPWQPIETAPKDRPILLCDGDFVGSGQFGNTSRWGARKDGFYFDGAALQSKATHWMHLPPLPKEPQS